MPSSTAAGIGNGSWPRILAAGYFQVDPGGAGTYTLPSFLSIASSTTNRTSQISATSIRTGFGANAARARSVDGSTFGLSIENAATNYCKGSNGDFNSNWSVGSGAITISSATDPGGGSSNCSLNDTSNSVASFMLLGGLSIPGNGVYTTSMWIKSLTTGQTSININLTGIASLVHNGIDSNWTKITATNTASSTSGNIVAQPLNSAALTGIMQSYGLQLEAGKYPTSTLLTNGSTAARNADVLSIPSPTSLFPSGYFDVQFTFAPNYANTEQTSDHSLLWFDSSNSVYLQQSTSKIILKLGGSAIITSSALTWSRNQSITVRVKHTSSGRFITISGATTGNGTTTDTSAVSAVTIPSTVYLLGSSTGAEEASDLRSIYLYSPS